MIALTREVSPRIIECELTHLSREPIDFDRAVQQHHQYEALLASIGITIRTLPALPDHADSVFVEDTAIVVPELAVMMRPGAESRRGEVESVAEVLSEYRPVVFVESSGTIDGGDVLVVGTTIYVGESTRTNGEAIAQLQSFVAPHGYKVEPIRVTSCLHLKSAVTRVAEDAVLLNPEWVDASIFSGLRVIHVDPDEPSAGNAVFAGSGVVYDAAFVKTRERLKKAGIRVHPVDMSELQKAEGAVTCCSILYTTKAIARAPNRFAHRPRP